MHLFLIARKEFLQDGALKTNYLSHQTQRFWVHDDVLKCKSLFSPQFHTSVFLTLPIKSELGWIAKNLIKKCGNVNIYIGFIKNTSAVRILVHLIYPLWCKKKKRKFEVVLEWMANLKFFMFLVLKKTKQNVCPGFVLITLFGYVITGCF